MAMVDREPDAPATEPEDEADVDAGSDELEDGAEDVARGIEGNPGPSTTTGGGAVDGESVGGRDGATSRTSSPSAVNGFTRSVASSSATAAS